MISNFTVSIVPIHAIVLLVLGVLSFVLYKQCNVLYKRYQIKQEKISSLPTDWRIFYKAVQAARVKRFGLARDWGLWACEFVHNKDKPMSKISEEQAIFLISEIFSVGIDYGTKKILDSIDDSKLTKTKKPWELEWETRFVTKKTLITPTDSAKFLNL